MQKILIATHNPGKIREYQALLADLPLTVTSLQAEGISYDVPEIGTTFAENAILKAEGYAQLSGLLTWADDSGLEIDALEGRPGVYSARYGGPGLTDRQRYQAILTELALLPNARHSARFQCVIALALPGGETHTVAANIAGVITDTPRGEFGFGYDPIFYLPEFKVTMAELSPEVKNRISHRARASYLARKKLSELLKQ
jgi:XTP/dITP diphosphohydrolase